MKANETDALEPRRMLSMATLPIYGPSASDLRVRGTAHADTITIARQTVRNVRYVDVTLNGKTTRYQKDLVSQIFVEGRNGDDRIVVGDGVGKPLRIDGAGGNDRIDVGSAATVTGGSGNDALTATGSADVDLNGNGDGDTLTGGAGRATLVGEGGDDSLVGGTGKVTLNGGDGDDFLIGGTADDVLFGGRGGDLIDGRAGRDLYTDGDPDDSDRDDNFDGKDDDDALSHAYGSMFDAAIHVTFDQVANDGRDGDHDDVRDAEILVGSLFADVIDCSRAPAGITIPLGKNYGPDSIIGSAFADEINARRIDGSNEPGSTIRGGAGDDTITTGDGDDRLFGEAGNDRLIDTSGDSDHDLLDGGSGNDRLTTGQGDDTLIGGAGNDSFTIGGYPFDVYVVRGGSGRDTLAGDADDDVTGIEVHA